MARGQHHEAASLLAGKGLERTGNRVLVLSRLLESDRPMSAGELHESLLSGRAPNKVTVYRILDLLAERGLVRRVRTGGRSCRYCAAARKSRGHGHFHCKSCGEVRCIDNARLGLDEKSLVQTLAMEVIDVELRLVGVCDRCSASR